MKFVLENVASARATTTSQEFADFYSTNGIGTYEGQVRPMKLINIDPDLTGFEGGFPTNTSTEKYHGYLIPYHNGRVPALYSLTNTLGNLMTLFIVGIFGQVGSSGPESNGQQRDLSAKLSQRISD